GMITGTFGLSRPTDSVQGLFVPLAAMPAGPGADGRPRVQRAFVKGRHMDVVDISRWQFGITTVYHFIFVPLTIGLALLVALMQTFWQVTGKEHWYRATRFFGTILLINFAMGVATGIVQEFQFGMNWSEYSRMVGDVFGG